MPRRPLARTAILLALLSCAACTTWRRDDTVLSQPVPERKQVQLFAGGSAVKLQGLQVAGDSVSYVLYFQAPDCDSCRVTLARSGVDSTRVRATSAPRTLLLLGAIAAFIFIPDWPQGD